ncbi:hypothetical protein [Dyadobacter tibetensis]|uniref:hypothetical protein n=1 Tax=Dyadobacter tibetensis TaxID=1211851 RepID=UPI000471A736|nr:hypothetical protein [Dyadobacter tibetensis]
MKMSVHAQTSPELNELTGFTIKAYYSPGNEDRARRIVGQCESALKYVQGLVYFMPEVRVFVLSPEHWKEYATFPLYGMPHYTADNRLVVASEDNDFWRSFIPPLDEIPSELAEKIKSTYTTGHGSVSTMAFFDLLALHELGHGFHQQGGLTMQRLWMQELFCNIMLHIYIAENEPEKLPALTVFPDMVVASRTSDYEYTSLADFERLYDNMDPENYGWYQCRLHVAGKDIYEGGGASVFVKLWKLLKAHSSPLSDEHLVELLNEAVSPEIADVYREW